MKFEELKSIDQLKNKNVIGVDETGVGDYFSPLVCCAVLVKPEQIQELKNLGVLDSKKINDVQIRKIAMQIKNIVQYSIAHLSQKGYNNLVINTNKFANSKALAEDTIANMVFQSKKQAYTKYNANELKFFIHTRAVNLLEEKNVEYDLVFIDQYSTLNSIQKYYQNLILNNNWANLKEFSSGVYLAQKAENKHIAVACASIIARDFLLYYMDKQREKYNFNFLLGASPKVKEQVKEFAQINGLQLLKEVCKLNFKI